MAFVCLNVFIYFPHQALNTSECRGYGQPNTSTCSSMIWGFQDSSFYTPEPYIGGVCTSFLLDWQDCAVGPTESGIIVINTTVDQEEKEQLAKQALQVIS